MVVQMINWQTEYSIPIQSFAFVLANDVPYCIFLTLSLIHISEPTRPY